VVRLVRLVRVVVPPEFKYYSKMIINFLTGQAVSDKAEADAIEKVGDSDDLTRYEGDDLMLSKSLDISFSRRSRSLS
jgi:hypothetical protein